MQTNKDVPCGNAPRPATSIIELLDEQSGKLRQELARLVVQLDKSGLSSGTMTTFLSGLREAVGGFARNAVKGALEAMDAPASTIEFEGERLRYRGQARKQWLTMFGTVEVERRIYRGNGAGAKQCAPLDSALGMVGRYMLPDAEDAVAMAMAILPQREAEQLLAKVLPESPSATAMRNAIEIIGEEINDHRKEIERAVDAAAPLADGEILAVSFDGVMIAMSEVEGPAWREASVGSMSAYAPGQDGPEQRDVRYLARMPESKMESLFDQAARLVAAAREERQPREFVVICDGGSTLWSQIDGRVEFEGATLILDYFHAAENLMKAAHAIFGDTERARTWHEKLCNKLQVEGDGPERAIRSMRRYRARLRKGSARWKIVNQVMGYFANHCDKMRYADFMQRGLPVGSGPVESAANTIVQARMKRSGMRWSMDGGQRILDLRTYLKAGRWDAMWSALKSCTATAA